MEDIHYLFPLEEIGNLPKWRFYLHFIAPDNFTTEMLTTAKARLRIASFSMIKFPLDFDEIKYEKIDNAVSIPFYVAEEDRLKSNSLDRYNSELSKIIDTMVAAGFSAEIYYEAIDWKE